MAALVPPEETRTFDLPVMSGVLCQLSYGGINMAGARGFEPRKAVLEAAGLPVSLHSHCQRTNKKPRLSGGLVLQNALRPSKHDSPHDPLGHPGYPAFEGLMHRDFSQSEFTLPYFFCFCNSISLISLREASTSMPNVWWRDNKPTILFAQMFRE